MEIGFGRENDILEMKKLWKEVFGDSEEYIDFFFKRCYPYCRSVVARVENTVAAMLFLLPSTLSVGEERYPAAYIYAVATHPSHRRRGYSRDLLDFTHKQLSQEGFALSYLRPASESLFDFYGRYGFINQFGAKDLPLEQSEEDAPRLVEATLQDLETNQRSFLSRHSMAMLWDKSMLGYIQEELEYGKGRVWALEDKSGYAVCYPTEDGFAVKELLAQDVQAKKMLLAGLKKQLKGNIVVRVEGDTPFAMAYWYQKQPNFPIEKCYVGLVLDS